MIPYVDLGRANVGLRDELLVAIGRVLDHGQLILGPEVQDLEHAVAEHLGAHQVVGVGSGTAALTLGLTLVGVGAGDEVIVPSHTFVATASAVALLGARPVFVDIDSQTASIDPARVAEAITPATRAIVPVHLGGIPADMVALTELSVDRGIPLVEDAAQAFGASLGGRMVGTFGVGCFSLHPLKAFAAAGDAGLLVLPDPELADEARRLRNLGLVDRGVAGVVAGHSRLDTVQAAILLVKLEHFHEVAAARCAHAAAYREALADVFELVAVPPTARPVYSTFVIRHPRRDALIDAMRDAGIDLKVHYPVPVHRQRPFAHYATEPLPVTDRWASEIVSLPVSPELSVDDRDEVIDRLLRWARSSGGPTHG